MDQSLNVVSMVHLPPPPFPVWICTPHIHTVCNGGGGAGCLESIYRSYTLCIWPDSEPIKLPLPSQTKTQTDKHLRVHGAVWLSRCCVAQLVARRLAVRQARVRFGSAPQGGVSHWADKRWRNGARSQRMVMDKCIVWMWLNKCICYKIWKINKKSGILSPNLEINTYR